MLGVPTTTALIERLDVDKSLRRILGWERRSQVPSEATFSRAFAEFAQGDLPDKMHAALIERSLGGRIVGVIARDATEIEAREKPVKTEPNDKRRIRRRPMALSRRASADAAQGRGTAKTRADAPRTADHAEPRSDARRSAHCVRCRSKKNSKGYKETWIGDKLHLDVACGEIPVSCVLPRLPSTTVRSPFP